MYQSLISGKLEEFYHTAFPIIILSLSSFGLPFPDCPINKFFYE